MCGLKEPNNPESEEKYVFSITHLRIDSNHPLAGEVHKYIQKTFPLIVTNYYQLTLLHLRGTG